MGFRFHRMTTDDPQTLFHSQYNGSMTAEGESTTSMINTMLINVFYEWSFWMTVNILLGKFNLFST